MPLIPNWIQAVSKKIAAKNNLRPALKGVYLTNTHVMATDSFKAVYLKLSTEEQKTTDIAAYPKKESDRILTLEEGEKIFIHSDVINWVKFKPNKHAKILDNIGLLLKCQEPTSGNGGTYGIRVDDLTTSTTYEARRNDGHFPDIENITKKILEKPAKDRVKVNIDYFIEVLQTLKERGSRNCIIESRELDGVIITPDDAENYDSYAIVMPLKF